MNETPEDPFKTLPFKVNIIDLGVTLEFESYQELANWADDELALWSNLVPKIKNTVENVGASFTQPLLAFYTQLRDHAREAIHDDPNVKNRGQERVATHLRALENGTRPTSKSQIGDMIFELSETEPRVSFGLLAWQMKDVSLNAQQVPNIFGLITAMTEARMRTFVSDKAIKTQEEGISRLRNRWQGRFQQLANEQSAQVNANKDSYVQGRKLAAGALRHFLRERREHFRSMTEMRNTFSTEMKLRASEKFWSEKRRIHENRAKRAISLLKKAMPGCAVVAITAFYLVRQMLGASTGFNTAEVFAYGLIVLFTIWPLRLIVADYRTNKTQSDDANERVAMVFTFKALEAEGRVSDEERAIILQALFRPHEAKPEDTMPSPVWDAILKRIEKTKGD